MSQMLAGTRPTFVLASVAALTTVAVAMVVAVLGGLFRGIIDAVMSRFSDALLLLPAPIFMVVIGSGEFSQKIGPVRFGLIYGLLTGLGAGAIVLRSQALKIMASPYIDAA
jgi:ABC-type dipeptide/oligopeptide/nickel transport system permease subunit